MLRLDKVEEPVERKAHPTRVLFIADHLGHTEGVVHGVTTYALNTLPALTTAGVEVTACFLRGRHPAAPRLEEQGILPLFFDRGKWSPLALLDLARLAQDRRVDLLHAAGMKGILLGRVVSRLLGRPLVAHLHDTKAVPGIVGALHRHTAHWTDVCLAVSDAVGEFASEELGIPQNRVRTLHNGIPLQYYLASSPRERERIRGELRIGEHQPVVGVVGRFDPVKGHAVLIESLPELLRSRPDLRALLIGDGPAREECARLAAGLGVDGAVIFAGQRWDVPALLAAMDVLAVPSLSEGLPYSVLEGMASGRPIVASRVGGIPELLVHEKSALLVDAGSPRDLAAAILRVLSDPGLRDRLGRGAGSAVERFGMDRHVSELMQIYETLLRRPPSAPLPPAATPSMS